MTMHGIAAVFRREHIENPRILITPEDVDEMINILLESDITECAAQMYSLDRPRLPSGIFDHSFIIGVREDREAGVVSSADGGCEEPNVVSVGNHELGRGPVYYCQNGSSFDFPLFSEIPIEKVREVAKEFVASGGRRPNCVDWDVAGYHDQ
ncbi:Imm1 family immunity protein [Streptomyces sp. NPDC026589]|uniref:Imm1 family immunity protein n=1 Tax=Streptomyces sp. NPDC026589 TaxID=3155609 RepID=UPI0033F668A5